MSVVVLAAGCAEMYGPEQESTPVVKSDGIEISLVTDGYDTDNTVVFSLKPKGEALYYSYAVEASATNNKPDSSVIYSGKYAQAVASAVIKWTEEQPSSTITVSDLAPNTQYQIYAVAGSPTGVPSSVAVCSFKTTDGEKPAITSDYDGNVLTISFSEAVTRNKDLPLSVKYYGVNTTNIDNTNTSNTENTTSNNSNAYGNTTNTSSADSTNNPATVTSTTSTSSTELSLADILNVLIIVIGVLLILLAIAILIRLKK